MTTPFFFSLVFCRVYMPDHSYVTIRSRLSASVQDILTSVTEKLQYSDEQPTREEALILVTVASSGGKSLLGAGMETRQQGSLTNLCPYSETFHPKEIKKIREKSVIIFSQYVNWYHKKRKEQPVSIILSQLSVDKVVGVSPFLLATVLLAAAWITKM